MAAESAGNGKETQGPQSVQTETKQKSSSSGNGQLRFKNGPYLTPKVERIMLQIARGKPVSWIAQLYDVREAFVHYIARKTGFPASALLRQNQPSAETEEDLPEDDHDEEIPQEEVLLQEAHEEDNPW